MKESVLKSMLEDLGLRTQGVFRPYDVSFRFSIVSAQAAASRLFEVRQPTAGAILIPTRLQVQWLQVGAHTAAILDSLDLYKATAFTAVDDTNTVTPTVSKRRSAHGAPTAAVRHVTVAGAAAGMTGGTLTKDTNALASLTQWLLAAQPTAGAVVPVSGDMLDEDKDGSLLVLAADEGLVLENRVLLGAAAASEVVVDFEFIEATLQ